MPRSCAARTSLVASMRSSTSVGRIWCRSMVRISEDVAGIRKLDGRPPRALGDRRRAGLRAAACMRASSCNGVAASLELGGLREREQPPERRVDAVVVPPRSRRSMTASPRGGTHQGHAGVAAPFDEGEGGQVLQGADDGRIAQVADKRGAGGVVRIAHEGGKRQPVDAFDDAAVRLERPARPSAGARPGRAAAPPEHGSPQRDRRRGQILELGVRQGGEPGGDTQRNAEQIDRVLRMAPSDVDDAVRSAPR